MESEEYYKEMRKAQDIYTKAWMQVKSIIERKPPHWIAKYELVKTQPQIPIYTIEWNHHRWTFTSEEEAWLFADYWKLI